MAKVPPKAFYKLRIANRMRRVKYNLIAVEECIHKYLSIHYAYANSSEVSNSFKQITNILDDIMVSFGIEYSFGCSKNDSYTPIIIDRTAKSYFKMPIASTIRDIKNDLYDAKDFIIEYLKDNELEGKDETKHNISIALNLIDKIMNFIDLDESYGSPCSVEMSFGYDDEEEENDEEEEGEVCEYDYDNENEDAGVLKSYCKEVFTLNNCLDKDYSTLIDKSFDNGMADAIPVTLNDISIIRSNIGIWYKIYDEPEAGDEIDCGLFMANMGIEQEQHLDEYMNGNNDIYLPISSLLKLWYIIKDSQYYYENH